MKKDDCYFLGSIRKLHGLSGEVNIFLDVDDAGKYSELRSILVDIRGELVPYFIEDLNIIDDHTALVRFVDTGLEQATKLVKRDLYLPLSMLPKLDGNKFYYHEVMGFMLTDLRFGDIGPIAEVLSYPRQDLFRVMHGDKEVLIPVSDTFIRNVDRKKKQITVDCPEGLIDIYL